MPTASSLGPLPVQARYLEGILMGTIFSPIYPRGGNVKAPGAPQYPVGYPNPSPFSILSQYFGYNESWYQPRPSIQEVLYSSPHPTPFPEAQYTKVILILWSSSGLVAHCPPVVTRT